MKILYITMDPLESNTSANLRNVGLIKGLFMLGCTVDTFSLIFNVKDYSYDKTINLVENNLNKRYYFKANKVYERLRTKKTDKYKTNNNKKIIGNKEKSIDILKNLVIKFIKIILQNVLVYDLQKINVKNVDTNLIKNIEDYDIIISSSDPKSSHLIAEKIINSSKKKIQWIQYWGDPMLDDITSKNSVLKRIMLKKEEGRLLRKAQKVVYTSPLTLKKQQIIYKKEKDKMVYTVQAYISTEIIENEKNLKTTIGYFGNYSENIRNIEPLCKSVNNLDVQLNIVGNGKTGMQGDNIICYSKVNYEKVKELENSVDILVCLCNLKGTQIPGKIYYISSYQKPIIIVVDGEYEEQLKKFFNKFKRYIICSNTEEGIKFAIQKAQKEIDEGKIYIIPNEMKVEQVAKVVIASLDRKEGKKND